MLAKKTVIISEEQLLITNEGEVIKAKDLLYNKQDILCYDNGYKSASINKIKYIEKSLISIYGAQGRTIRCNKYTQFIGSNGEISAPIKEKENKVVKVFRYYPQFGNKILSNIALDYLASSLSNVQYKRPNPYTKQRIPLFISKLTRNNLIYVINYIFKNGSIKHLDQQSKDLMIIILSKLGIYFDGQPKQHSSNITGTLKILDSKNKVNYNDTKFESIGFLNKCKDKAIELSFNNSINPIIGSFLCQTN